MMLLSFVLALFVTFTNADDKKQDKGTKETKEKWCETPKEGHSVILDSKNTGLAPTKVESKKSKSVKESESCETEGDSKGCCGTEAKTKKEAKKDAGKPKN